MRNAGPKDLTLAQVIINDAVWPFSVTPSATIPRLGKAAVHLDYPWVAGEAYGISLFTTNSIPFSVEIPVAFETPEPGAQHVLELHPDRPVRGRDPGLPGSALVPGAAPAGTALR